MLKNHHNCKSFENNQSKLYALESSNFEDFGLISIMYHRFNENKYPSTNIQMDIFEKHMKLIKDLNYDFIHPDDFKKEFSIPKKQKKLMNYFQLDLMF